MLSITISLPPLSRRRTSFVVIGVPWNSRVVSMTRLEPSHFAVDFTDLRAAAAHHLIGALGTIELVDHRLRPCRALRS